MTDQTPDPNRQFLTTLDNLGIASHRLDQIRDAARLHRQQLIGTSELYAVIEAADPVPSAVPAPADRTAELLRRTESYLSALHSSVARHDNLAANLGCAGCELRNQLWAELRRMADETQPAEAEVVHACPPDGSGLTPCCGRTPFELPLTDRISSEAPATCPGAVGAQQPKEA